MIWARPLSPTGVDAALLVRARAPEALLEERLVLVTGLGGATRAALERVAGRRVAHAEGDALVVQLSAGVVEAWGPALDGHPELRSALGRLSALETSPEPTVIGPRRFAWGTRTFVMGVLNVTPDSFSDGGRLSSLDEVVAQAEAMAEVGVDLLDVGGESSRPGAEPVSEAEELARVIPAVEVLSRRLPSVALSVDTAKAGVARRAVEAGAHLVNDIGGLASEAMLEVVAELEVSACAMHMQGTPRTMQRQPAYDDVVSEVLEFLEERLVRAQAHGVPRHRVLVDPGIGFGKTPGHNLYVLRRLGDLRLLRAPVLVGTSRKAFLGALIGGRPPAERDVATAASVAVVAAARSADVVRVHDVASARDAVRVADALARAEEGGASFGA